MSYAKKKNLFHSELVQMTATNPVAMRIDSEVKKGKDPQKTPHGYLAVTVDNNEYWLTCETAQVASDLAQLKGQTVWVAASGSRATAKLSIMLSDPNVQDGDLPPTAVPGSSAAVANKPVCIDGARLGWAMKEALALTARDPNIIPGSPEWRKTVVDFSGLLLAMSDEVEKAYGQEDDVPF